ncbi:response regulator/GGDEF domain-containing protein [Arthrobacter nitrophenolicus]|uniref:Response regulator/GGDEF domain-containing protein n=1 Tax=Arthrobacter nitrophenolicus TaxID=683150 RepID=L8TV21_9MICC|nr:response regulator/GGDEF domain-containing protein [Arthrobacter nitrophenolicus]
MPDDSRDAMTVLVADDDAGSLLVAKAAVEKYGHQCIVAADGETAWQLFQERRPQVVVSDLVMPGLNGFDLCRAIRASEASSYTYVVLLTSHGAQEDVLEGMRAGADDYISKPLDPFVLHTRLLAARRVTAVHHALADAWTRPGEATNGSPNSPGGSATTSGIRSHPSWATWSWVPRTRNRATRRKQPSTWKSWAAARGGCCPWWRSCWDTRPSAVRCPGNGFHWQTSCRRSRRTCGWAWRTPAQWCTVRTSFSTLTKTSCAWPCRT